MSKTNYILKVVGTRADSIFDFSFAAIAFTLICGGFLFYSRFFSSSTRSISDLCLNSNFHYSPYTLIKNSVSSGATPITTNDLKIDFKLIDNAFRDMQEGEDID